MKEIAAIWEKFDVLKEQLGSQELCEALARAMGTDELGENLSYIARMYDIDFPEEEEEE